jgi:hypothetical protein
MSCVGKNCYDLKCAVSKKLLPELSEKPNVAFKCVVTLLLPTLWFTVHGRGTVFERTGVSISSIRLVTEGVQCPILSTYRTADSLHINFLPSYYFLKDNSVLSSKRRPNLERPKSLRTSKVRPTYPGRYRNQELLCLREPAAIY